jgi:hypothetical protein
MKMNGWHGFFTKYRNNKEWEDITKLNLRESWHPKQLARMNYLFLIAAKPGQPF